MKSIYCYRAYTEQYMVVVDGTTSTCVLVVAVVVVDFRLVVEFINGVA